MGRRSFGISATQVNRIASALSASKKAKEKEELIASQEDIDTEKAPCYRIINFDFNPESRVAHIEFEQTTEYRKIDRYVTQNYQRYPIYSDWLTRTKKIRKTIKLTNETLEQLNDYEDPLIADFSYEIVSLINSDEYFPSWFIHSTLVECKEDELDNIRREYGRKNRSIEEKILIDDKFVVQSQRQREDFRYDLKIAKNQVEKLEKSLYKSNKRRNFVFLAIITFGIYALIHSKKRINKLKSKLQSVQSFVSYLEEEIEHCDKYIAELNDNISRGYKEISENKRLMNEEIQKVEKKYDRKISLLVEPLPTNVNSSSEREFIPLKKLSGMNYEKIVGCYVIRNVENKKCYVGQSKDVLKRVCKQHFNGTKVNNRIFADDYYYSSMQNKEDMFEVRIIRLDTKDELDKKERELIEEYDAFNNGYNGTNGNQ